jgi:hypothetical protein
VHAVDVLETVIRAGQRRGELRSGQPILLTGIYFGCVLRPIILATLTGADALDLLAKSKHDRVIEDAAFAALRRDVVGHG